MIKPAPPELEGQVLTTDRQGSPIFKNFEFGFWWVGEGCLIRGLTRDFPLKARRLSLLDYNPDSSSPLAFFRIPPPVFDAVRAPFREAFLILWKVVKLQKRIICSYTLEHLGVTGERWQGGSSVTGKGRLWQERPHAKIHSANSRFAVVSICANSHFGHSPGFMELIMRDIFIKASEIYFSFLPSSLKMFQQGLLFSSKIIDSGGKPLWCHL